MKTPLIRIDAERHEVFVRNKRVKLPKKEWEILLALAASRKTMSRDDLMEIVWGHRIKLDTRTVDQHIARLRTKFPPNSVIETVPCYGYRIVLNSVAA